MGCKEMTWDEKYKEFGKLWGDDMYIDILSDDAKDVWEEWLEEFGHEKENGEWEWMSQEVIEDYIYHTRSAIEEEAELNDEYFNHR